MFSSATFQFFKEYVQYCFVKIVLKRIIYAATFYNVYNFLYFIQKCGSCYGAETEDVLCCNTCQEVKQQYLKQVNLIQDGQLTFKENHLQVRGSKLDILMSSRIAILVQFTESEDVFCLQYSTGKDFASKMGLDVFVRYFLACQEIFWIAYCSNQLILYRYFFH